MHESQVQALVIKARALVVGIGDVLVGILLGWFPRWHSSTSLVKLSHLGLPWPVIGLVFIGCSWLIVFSRSRVFGYGISAVLFFIGAVSSADTQFHAKTANALIFVGLFVLSGVLVCGVATAQVDQGRRRDAP